MILSCETILIRFAWRCIDSRHFLSISNPKPDAKYAARSILIGSSENVSSGSKGVTSLLACKSLTPLYGSCNSPNFFGVRLMAMALTVKSLLIKSPFKSV